MPAWSSPARSRSCRLLLAGTLSLAVGPVAHGQGWRWPEEPKNLKVLPPETKGEALGDVMRGFSISLGVRCEHCHVGQGPLANYDFPSDDKPNKEKARVMWKMIQAINGNHLAELTDLGVPEGKRLKVTCMTCHRGNSRPEMLGDVLAATVDSAGVDAAVDRYRELRETYYGGFAYDFTSVNGAGKRSVAQPSLLLLADRLSREGKSDAAIRMAQLEIEVNGETANAYGALGDLQARANQRTAAITSYERGEALATGRQKQAFRQRIERLRQRSDSGG